MKVFLNPHQDLHATGDLRLWDGSSLLETPQRISEILLGLIDVGLGSTEGPTDHGLDPISAVHPTAFTTFLKEGFAQAQRSEPELSVLYPTTFTSRTGAGYSTCVAAQAGYFGADIYSPILPGTWQAAYWGAQTVLSAVDNTLAQRGNAYALSRPPGHHASTDVYSGFCYLNNAAIAARYMQSKLGAGSRIAILDVDFHHGNGAQNIFATDPTILTVSIHGSPDYAYPYYSGWGNEVGTGNGIGFNLNIPIPEGTSDESYCAFLIQALERIKNFGPRALIVALGFDIAEGDPYAVTLPHRGSAVSSKGFSRIAELISNLAFPTVIVQEGGYRFEILRKCATAFFQPWG